MAEALLVTLQFKDPFTTQPRTITLCKEHEKAALKSLRTLSVGVSGTWAGSLARCDSCGRMAGDARG